MPRAVEGAVVRATWLVVLAGCDGEAPPPPDPGFDWSGAASEAPAPLTFTLTSRADGLSAGTTDEPLVCPPDSAYAGGLGAAAVCVDARGGHVAAITRNTLGHASFEPREVCPSSMAAVGRVGDASVCTSVVPGVVATLTAPLDGRDEAPFAEVPCPAGFDPVGFLDDATVCRTDGVGVIAEISRTPDGLTLRDVVGDALLCPAGFTALGRRRDAVVCWRDGAGTAVRLTRSVGVEACPIGFAEIGGDLRHTVCLHDATLGVVTRSRLPDGTGWPDLLDADAPCPEGQEMAGGDGNAVVCVSTGG